MKEHYQLKENQTLTEEQINDYLYKKAIGEITSQPPQNNPTNSSKDNKIPVLLLLGGVILVIVLLSLLVIKKIKSKK